MMKNYDVKIDNQNVYLGGHKVENVISYKVSKYGKEESILDLKIKFDPSASSESVAPLVDDSGFYGISWDGEVSKCKRIGLSADFAEPVAAVGNGSGHSPFDDIYPWSNMKIKHIPSAGDVVAIPKFYFRLEKHACDSGLNLAISPTPREGFYVSPAHADRGDGHGERDVAYVGRYHCSNLFKSQSEKLPKTRLTRAEFREKIHELGDTIFQYDIMTHITLWMLYLVEYADWDSQKTIGYGCSENFEKEETGATDGMVYHTGTSAKSRDQYGHTQYRYIEDLWGNVFDWCDGIRFKRNSKDEKLETYVIKNPADFSDEENGDFVCNQDYMCDFISGWDIPGGEGYEWFIHPSEAEGDEDGPVGDSCHYLAGGVVLFVGGYYGQYRYYGLFYLYGSNAASDANAYIGSRLLILPAAA